VRVVRAAAAADRPLWFPGNPAPAHLDGSLAGDYGFDPLNLGQEPDTLRWCVSRRTAALCACGDACG